MNISWLNGHRRCLITKKCPLDMCSTLSTILVSDSTKYILASQSHIIQLLFSLFINLADLTSDTTKHVSSTDLPGICSTTSPPSCVAVPVSGLGWDLQDQHQYQMTLVLHSVTQLTTRITSETYKHVSTGLSTDGIVMELSLADHGSTLVRLFFPVWPLKRKLSSFLF